MRTYIQKIVTVVKTASRKWFEKDPFRESAVIAYYAIFALPGLLVIIMTLCGYFFGREAVNNQVAAQFSATIGSETAKQIQDIIIQASQIKNSLLATILGIATILIGATGVFAAFQQSLNTIWEVTLDTKKSGIWQVIRVRLFSFGLIISISFLLIISLLVSTLLAAFGSWLSSHFSDSFLLILTVINYCLSFSVLAVLFALMFKVLPDAKIKWKHVWIGSFVTAFLFEIGKFALGLYFGNANPGTGYGAAGSIILIMLWVSYSSMIVFFGAEFTHAYANMFSGKVTPNDIGKVKLNRTVH
ncbi:MAG: YihY/virulence factor BrkB family protein [Bacteroidales bacterium]|nr:YihY/virulence factor BrkB family protein [Bacteroidales bacterium]